MEKWRDVEAAPPAVREPRLDTSRLIAMLRCSFRAGGADGN